MDLGRANSHVALGNLTSGCDTNECCCFFDIRATKLIKPQKYELHKKTSCLIINKYVAEVSLKH